VTEHIQERRYNRECKYCGGKLPYSKHVFCSRLCAQRWQAREYKRNATGYYKVKLCVVCGEQITGSGIKYCSSRCHNKANYRPKPVKRERVKTCVICGASFVAHGPQKACSVECQKENNRIAARKGAKRLRKREKEEALMFEDYFILPDPIIRECLRCDKPFPSYGNHVCPICTKINAYLVGGVDWHYHVKTGASYSCSA